ncbi:hypothetical protein O181_069564 [Austropuccinia psidii MF-1]|uniref:Retrovirus-related Pol polyprotein from transposon TNT 1-94-like beta-barrel domain-containing protein n=1 Tax=Austropuccinia psidii MF-1 TaxID=1389203 RepID=A0A9Q3EZJ3_9BASI|nr:hypothetical protein [Austropuccinia psidii MF-1]
MAENNTDRDISSVPILTGTNFSEWHGRITILLQSKDLLDMCEKPLDPEASTTLSNKWKKSSYEAVNIIASRVSNQVFLECVNQETIKNSYSLWTKINEQYASKRAINRGRVWMDWLNSSYSGDLQEYINNSRRVMLDLESVNIIVPAELLSFTLLGKLRGDSKLHQYVEVLTLNDDLVEKPNLILSKLQDFYNNSRLKENLSITASAHLSESSGPYKIMYYCANGKHNPNCTNHSKEECFAENPHLRPPRRENKRKTGPNRSPAAHFASAAQAFITGNNLPSPGQFLIVDCGATHHMFNSKKMFTSFEETVDIQVSTGDSSSSLIAKAVGTVSISCDGKIVSLKNCLYVPKLNRNLISLLELCQDNMLIKRTSNSFTLESDGIQILKGTIINNLMQVAYSLPTSLTIQAPINLWHMRLGHPGEAPLKTMGLPSLQKNCQVCEVNKATLLPFNDEFEHYFLTIVDQFTSFKTVRLLKSKSDAFEQFVIVKNLMENLHDQKLKKLVSDRGETPQHNGFPERANRSILAKARCLLNGSNLPSNYWAEAILTATMLCNLIPTPSRHNLCPYSVWKGVPPQIKKLRVFGCRAVVSLTKTHCEWKLSPTGIEGILLGYENDNTSYWVLRLSDRKVIIS